MREGGREGGSERAPWNQSDARVPSEERPSPPPAPLLRLSGNNIVLYYEYYAKEYDKLLSFLNRAKNNNKRNYDNDSVDNNSIINYIISIIYQQQ